MKNKGLWIYLGGLVVLLLAFLGLNFHAAASNTSAERTITTTSMGDQLPECMQHRDKIKVEIVAESGPLGNGRLISALQKSLPAELSKVVLVESELAQETQSANENPALRIEISKPGMFWTPFFASSRFTIRAGYASNGNTAFMGDTTVVMDNMNGPVVNMTAEYTVSDQSWGIISRPGYDQILADWMAKNISEATKNLYEVKNIFPTSPE